jgi:hypothetical protein
VAPEAPADASARPAPPECRIYDELLEASHQRLADYASEEPHRAWARAKADAFLSPETAERLAKPAAVAVRDALVHGDFAAAARFIGPDGVCVQDRIGGPCKQLTADELAACGTSTDVQPYIVDLVANTTQELTCRAAMQRVLFPIPALATAAPTFNCFPARDDADPMSVITADRGVEDIYVELHAPAAGATPWRSVWLMFSVASGQPRWTAIAPQARVQPVAAHVPAADEVRIPDSAVSATAFGYNDGADIASPGFCRSLYDGATRCASAGPPKQVSARHLESLRTLLASPRAWSKASSRCVPRPHHGLELFDAHGARIGVVDICFECATITSGTTIRTATPATMKRLAGVMKALGLGQHLDRWR